MNAAYDEPFPASGHIAIATLAVEVKSMKDTLTELRDEVRKERDNHVSRNEWEQRNKTIDERFAAIIADTASRRVPWTGVAAILIAAGALMLNLTPYIID